MARGTDDLMLGTLKLFCLAAELQSFAAAAQRAGLSPAAVSRAIARMEARVGVQLFARSTRKVRLTEEGRRYAMRCREALDQLIEAERELGGQQMRPSGTVAISMPTPLGHRRILPLLPMFRQRYPEVRVDVHLSNRNIDLVAEGYDLAVRGREPPDSGLIARPLMDDPLVVVAAPAYLARAGRPQQPAELDSHECIQFILPRSGQSVPWLFRRDGQDYEMTTAGGLSCAEDLLGTITLARHGGGLLQVPRFMVEEDLAAGTLTEVLENHAGATRRFSLLYPARRNMPSRVRALVDFLLAAFGHV